MKYNLYLNYKSKFANMILPGIIFGLLLLSGIASAITSDYEARWAMNSTVQAYDAKGLYNGTSLTSVTLAPDRNGNSNQAYKLTGSQYTPYIVTYTNEDSLKGWDNGTWSFWINMTNYDAGQYFELMEIDTSGYSNDQNIQIASDGILKVSNQPDTVSYMLTSTLDFDTASNLNRWILVTFVWNQTGRYLYINGTLNAEDRNATIGGSSGRPFKVGVSASTSSSLVMDDMRIYKRGLNSSDIEELYTALPISSITLVSPTNSQVLSEDGANFTARLISEVNNQTWRNATYYIWYSNGTLFNSTVNSSISGNNTNVTTFIDDFDLGQNYKWNVRACTANITTTLCYFSDTNFTFTNLPFTVSSTNYNSSVYETSAQSFELNILANPQVSSVYGYLWYNGTRHSSSITDNSGGSYSIRNSIDIPLQDVTGDKNLLWQLFFTLTNGVLVESNTSTYTQQVNRTTFIICNSTYNTRFINFTSKSAENPFPIINATFKSSWETYLGSGDVKRNYTYEDVTSTNSSWSFCSFPNSTIKVNSEIEYDSSGYALNFYYLNNASLTNITQAISLYLLNDSKSTLTVLKTVDDSQTAQEDITIQIQFYDVGTGTFYLVGMARTDYKGEDIAYLNWYDSLYKFVFLRNGVFLKTTNTTRITATPTTFNIESQTALAYQKFKDFVYTLYFNNATNNFVLTFTKPSGLVDQGCLRVIRRTASNDTQICLTCESSSSATVYCNINSYGNGTYIAKFYATGSWYDLHTITHVVGGGFSTAVHNLLGEEDGTFYAIMFSGIITAMFFVHPVFGIIGVLLGIIASAALGFTQIEYMTFIGLALVGGIIIWIIKR